MYIYTLDSHDCYGPFKNRAAAEQWLTAMLPHFRHTYQILRDPPFQSTLIISPYSGEWPSGWRVAGGETDQ